LHIVTGQATCKALYASSTIFYPHTIVHILEMYTLSFCILILNSNRFMQLGGSNKNMAQEPASLAQGTSEPFVNNGLPAWNTKRLQLETLVFCSRLIGL